MFKIRFMRGLLILFSILLLSSCTTINSREFGSPQISGEPYEKRWVSQHVYWSFGKTHIQTNCPEGQEVIQHRVWVTPGQGLLTFFIGLFYSPVMAGYWCG